MRKQLIIFLFFILVAIICISEVVLVSPIKKEQIRDANVLFKWDILLQEGEEPPNTYSIYIGNSPTELELYLNNIVGQSCYIYSFPNIESTEVYWQINAEYLNGKILQSNIEMFELRWESKIVMENAKGKDLYPTYSGDDPSELEGKVIDAYTKKTLKDVSILLKNQFTHIPQQMKTTENGQFKLNITYPVGYQLTLAKSGYSNIEYNVHYWMNTGDKIYLEPFEMVEEKQNSSGSIKGGIFDAGVLYGRVHDATIYVRKGYMNITGSYFQKQRTDSTGYYFLEGLPSGNYTLEFEAEGFINTFSNITVLDGKTKYYQNVAMSRVLTEKKELRVVLNWNQSTFSNELDLDGHLLSPVDHGGWLAINPIKTNKEDKKIPGFDKTKLLDVISDSGLFSPETITIKQLVPGDKYRFLVSDYSNRNEEKSNALSESNAIVTVYQGERMISRFPVPPNEKGLFWLVFELEIEIDGRANIKPLNVVTHTYEGL